MREIKFRAWIDESDLCNREELHNHLTDNNEFIPFMQDLNDWYFDDGQTLGDYFSNFGIGNVMQYTGLKDKNGTEIYEGDILYFEPYKTHSNDRVVEYIDGAYHGRLIRNGYSKLLAECVYETKVIGNIYENPELLEVQE